MLIFAAWVCRGRQTATTASPQAAEIAITIRGAAVDTFKIHFSPAGALAPFWGADIWYRASDGAYVSSRLPENGGTTLTTIEDANQ